MELKGSKTEENLRAAFDAEARVFTKYTLFAEAAARQGFEEIAAVFRLAADNEKAHAALWATRLGDVRSVNENLKSSAGGESFESDTMYPGFAATAREEGFAELADTFGRVGRIENNHAGLFGQFFDAVQSGRMFSDPQSRVWICRNCGNLVVGTEPPVNCTVCGYPQAFFERKVDYLPQN